MVLTFEKTAVLESIQMPIRNRGRVLLTGATGFIGVELTGMLLEQGYIVHRMMRYVSGGRYDSYSKDSEVHFADLRDRESVARVVWKVSPEYVIHLAAQAAVSYSFFNPIDVNEVNYIGTLNLAEACREYGVSHFIHASTSEVYGKSTIFPTPEEHPLGATSPYAVSKIAAENYLMLMWELHRFPVTIIRPFNTFGRANVKNRHYVVERAITQALEEGWIRLHDPAPYRDFLYRTDHAMGYVKALEAKPVGEVINLSHGTSWSIKEMAYLVAEHVRNLEGTEVKVSFLENSDRPLDIPKLEGTNEKAEKLLGWKPQFGISDGLWKAILEWRKELQKYG